MSFVKGISGALTFVTCVPDCFCLNELLLPNKLSQDAQYVGLVFRSYFPAFSLHRESVRELLTETAHLGQA